MRRVRAFVLSSLFAFMAIGIAGCGGSDEIVVPTNPSATPAGDPADSGTEGDTPPPLEMD